MTWKIELTRKAEKDLVAIPQSIRKRISAFLHLRIGQSENPRNHGTALKGELKGLWRYRVGDYRIVARIEDENVTVLVVRIDHRKDIYE